LSVASLILSVLAAPTLFARDYDLVITGGRVIDPETLYDDVAYVGIKDGRIATITKEKISGRETIKAKGMVVAPGVGTTLGYMREGVCSRELFEVQNV
jgi:N-acyl-D-glutamate deacylase